MNTARKLLTAITFTLTAAASLAALPANASGFLSDITPRLAANFDDRQPTHCEIQWLLSDRRQPLYGISGVCGCVFESGSAARIEKWEEARRRETLKSSPLSDAAAGNFCGNHIGKFGPGPFAPLGSPCQTPYGPGAIVR